MNNRILAMLAVLASLSACQKKDDTAPAADKVVMNITSPQAGQTFHNGDTIAIKAAVSYTSELHGYEVIIADTATGITMYDEAQHVHNDQFIIDDKWIGAATRPATLKLTIIAEIDHNGNEARKSLNFQITP